MLKSRNVVAFDYAFLRPFDFRKQHLSSYFAGSLPATAMKKDVLNIDRDVIGMILIIPGVTAANSGSYKCEIQNQLGKDTRTFKVTVS